MGFWGGIGAGWTHRQGFTLRALEWVSWGLKRTSR